MTKDEMKNRISMALKDPTLQQGFEIICKENAELKKACDETQELLDKQIEATYKLDKENAELKDYRLTTLAKQQTENQKYTVNLEHKLSWYDDQLAKAKEIIEGLMRFCRCFAQHHTEDIRYKEAEQFLNENEE